MKKAIIPLLFLSILFFATVSIFYQTSNNSKSTNGDQNISTDPKATDKPETATTDSSNYKIEWLVVKDTSKLLLKSNLSEKLTSKEAKEKHECSQLVNGGFFTQQDKPIGLFVSDFELISKTKISPTFNGFFSIDRNGEARISSSPPYSSRLAIQAGPLLIKNNNPLNLKLANDKPARRIVVATTVLNEVVFLAIFNKNSVILGPNLSELPEILKGVEDRVSLTFEYALNLDGGSHSAFISDTISLPELSIIGGYFCLK